MTLREAGHKLGFADHTELSKIERGLQQYTQSLLEGSAKLYQCSVLDLLTRAPGEDDDLFTTWENLSEAERRRLRRAIRDEEE